MLVYPNCTHLFPLEYISEECKSWSLVFYNMVARFWLFIIVKYMYNVAPAFILEKGGETYKNILLWIILFLAEAILGYDLISQDIQMHSHLEPLKKIAVVDLKKQVS